MELFEGKSVFGGIAIGKIRVYRKNSKLIQQRKIANAQEEIERFHEARENAKKVLSALYEKALNEVGAEGAAIFEVHQMMMDDADYNDSVENIIRSSMVNAEYAISVTADEFSDMFAAMEDEYMQARAADVKDISERLIGILYGEKQTMVELREAIIVVAEDLTPSETVQMDKDKVLSFVTTKGSVNSHSAILARTMGIPAIVGAEAQNHIKNNEYTLLDEKFDGVMGIVDGNHGLIYVNPDAETMEKFSALQREELRAKELLQSLKGKENITVDGKKIMLYANIGNPKDLPLAIHNDAGGIGLFRSEFLYLEKSDYPTEEEQFEIYKNVVSTMQGKMVIIRTLDIGADKQSDYFNLDREENPALGYRAIRLCLDRPKVFKTQLRALFRASVYGELAIMYPMITSMWEIKKIKEIVEEVKAELAAEKLAFASPKQGIMIETPAAVMISDELAKEVDFFSIGTNDLTQYTLAIDRQNAKLDAFYDAHHPAILKMIEMVVENAHEAGIWVGICGELGADLTLTRKFLEMGIDELSVSPGSILPIRRQIRETNLHK